MKAITSEREVNALIAKPAAMLKFSAEWCGPCKAIAPVVDKLVEAAPQIACAAVDIDAASDVAQRFTVSAVPTFLFFKRGQLVQTIKGADAHGVAKAIDALKSSAGPATANYEGRGHKLSDKAAPKGRSNASQFPGSQFLPAPVQTVLAYFMLYILTFFSFNALETANQWAPRLLPQRKSVNNKRHV